MLAAAEIEPAKTDRNSARLAAFEVAWIFLIFFLAAGSLPPDVGESHYLVKAKHYWNPAWCAGDLFVESRDAHAVFNWTLGWVTRFFSLSVAAWIGRVVTWLFLAWTWRRLSFAVLPRPLLSLLSAGWMLLLLRHFHLAGEWIVGGVEAKGLAYGLVFVALEAVARNRWRAALLFAGGAGAFHVLVGGWTVVAIGLAWLMPAADRPRLISLLPAAALGFVLALPGLVPAVALNWGVPAEVQREAARIYVYERLSHHLVFHAFAAGHIARFQGLVVGWGVLAWLLRGDVRLGRVQRVVAGTMVIALVGVLIDQIFVWRSDDSPVETWQTGAAKLLRYYWFRMSDSLVPIGTALAIVVGLDRLKTKSPGAGAWLLVAAILIAAANVAEIGYWRSLQNVPPAILQSRPTGDARKQSWFALSWFAPAREPTASEVTTEEWYRDWRAVCKWVSERTPADAMFLTPREQQTFKWYAGRKEVVNWKDVPQDASGLIEWRKRIGEVYPRDRVHNRQDLAAFSDAELVELARRYGASHIVIDRTRAGRRLGLPKLYPQFNEDNLTFEVYLVPQTSGALGQERP